MLLFFLFYCFSNLWIFGIIAFLASVRISCDCLLIWHFVLLLLFTLSHLYLTVLFLFACSVWLCGTSNSERFKMQAQQGRRTRTPSLGGTSSIYSYASTTRTMSRSMKSLRVAWYKRPLVQDAFFTDIQTGAMLTAIFSMVISLKYTSIFVH